jgi:hypothetical protein
LAKGLSLRGSNLGLPFLRLSFPVAIVCANCEYESWFLADIDSLKPKYLNSNSQFTGYPEETCNAKEWLSRHMKNKYRETQDQSEFTKAINLKTCLKLRSFQRMLNALKQLRSMIESGKTTVTPPAE